MSRRDRTDYRQAHAGAAPVAPTVEAVERLGEQLDALVRNAGPRVDDVQRGQLAALPDPDLGEAAAAVVA